MNEKNLKKKSLEYRKTILEIIFQSEKVNKKKIYKICLEIQNEKNN